jgi:hypothetical protein
MGSGVTQSVFDTHPLGLPLLELDDDALMPPVPPPPDPLLLEDELASVELTVGRGMMSWHPKASSVTAAEIPTSPPI